MAASFTAKPRAARQVAEEELRAVRKVSAKARMGPKIDQRVKGRIRAPIIHDVGCQQQGPP